MGDWEAPAKVNLSLVVAPPRRDGYHPIRSLVQTLEWHDRLTVEVADEDRLDVDGAELDPGPSNLVWVAADRLAAAVSRRRPPLDVRLVKRVAVAAGLGGGSADAAAMLRAVAEIMGVGSDVVASVAAEVGADVPLFLVGGTCLIEGRGEQVTRWRPGLRGVAVAVVVPPFELPTAAVYRTWDRLGGPAGPRWRSEDLPPVLRSGELLRNDLYPAAVELRPELADWRSELTSAWGVEVLMSGSGPSLFSLFPSPDEAEDAVAAAPSEARAAVATVVRGGGVAGRGDERRRGVESGGSDR